MKRLRTISISTASLVALAASAATPATAQTAPDSTVAPPAASTMAAPAWPPVRTSWLADGTTLRVGSIVTVFIDEVTLASADISVFERRDRGRDVRFALPSQGTNFGLQTQNDVGEQEQGESSRRERFQAEMSARVVEIVGDLARIEGTRRMGIDEHEQSVTLRGWVRARDLSTQNTIESWRIADAEILYSSNGELRNTGGFWSTILNLILP
jgi:flagellar L-ring protein precursor FlgH